MPELRRILLMAFGLTLLWTTCRLALLKSTGIPQPKIHDEFSYLLGADTFAHGRVVNPPHALAKFFESPHVIVRPVYASKYPPGQALFLAFGQRLFGSPFYGVVIENALMIFTFCIMLGLWTPLPWASAASVMLACALMPPMYWANSYWGGSAAATGAALVLIAVGYARIRQPAILGAVFAAGAVLLFLTRPFEGAIFVGSVLLVFGKQLWPNLRWAQFAAALPVIALGAGFTAYVNKATTGSALLLPYVMHDRQYNVTPPFWFLPTRPEPHYSHPRLAAQHGRNGGEQGEYLLQHPWTRGLWYGFKASFTRLFALTGLSRLTFWALMPLLTILSPLAWTDPIFRRMTILAGICVLVFTFETWHFPHYSAPAVPALWIAGTTWALHAWNFRPPRGRFGPNLAVIFLVFPLFSNLHDFPFWQRPSWSDARAALIARLAQNDTKQLVLVRYPSPTWNSTEEWVYNSANIDAQRVILAHDLGQKEDAALLGYYPNRQAWLVTVTDSGYALGPIRRP